MKSNTLFQPTVPRGVRSLLAVLTVFGIVGVTLALMLGFEEAHTPTLWVSSAMILAAPMAALVHLSVTRGLTQVEKRIWLREFGSSRVWEALSEYLSSTNLSQSAKRRAQHRHGRQESQ